jgi:hypothetical protein
MFVCFASQETKDVRKMQCDEMEENQDVVVLANVF